MAQGVKGVSMHEPMKTPCFKQTNENTVFRSEYVNEQ